MAGETDLKKLLRTMRPKHNPGDYVFCVAASYHAVDRDDAVLLFKEEEGITVILKKERAEEMGLAYSFVASWITLTVHSSLEAVGLTAAVAAALSEEGISCNVVAAFYHDHIFVAKKDVGKAMEILNRFSL